MNREVCSFSPCWMPTGWGQGGQQLCLPRCVADLRANGYATARPPLYDSTRTAFSTKDLTSEMEHLRTDQLEELRAIFDMFAKPTRGSTEPLLRARELHAIFAASGLTMLTEAAVGELMTMLDTRGRGAIGFEDFAHAMTMYMADCVAAEELACAFKTADADGDGLASASDLHQFIDTLVTSGASTPSENASLRSRLSTPDVECILKELAERPQRGLTLGEFQQLTTMQLPLHLRAGVGRSAAPEPTTTDKSDSAGASGSVTPATSSGTGAAGTGRAAPLSEASTPGTEGKGPKKASSRGSSASRK